MSRYAIKSLLTSFVVNKLYHEPHGESTWWLEHPLIGKFTACDYSSQTCDEDELLINKTVDAQLCIDCYVKEGLGYELITQSDKQVNYMRFDQGAMHVIGQVNSELIEGDNNQYYSYLIDSIIPLEVDFSSNRKDLKKGDWIEFEGLTYIILPRGSYLDPNDK